MNYNGLPNNDDILSSVIKLTVICTIRIFDRSHDRHK